MHRCTMPLDDDQVHFNIDSWGGWIWPYRNVVPESSETTVSVHLRNPYPHAAVLEVRLVGPSGWRGTSAKLEAAPRAEAHCQLSITPNGACRRQPFAVELTVDGRRFGQVAEALLTVGSTKF